MAGIVAFWRETVATPASTFISFSVPLFLAHRHRRTRLYRPAEAIAPAGAVDGLM